MSKNAHSQMHDEFYKRHEVSSHSLNQLVRHLSREIDNKRHKVSLTQVLEAAKTLSVELH